MNKQLVKLSLLALMLPQVSMAATHVVDIKKFKFSPQNITINVGDSIIWHNREKRQYHNVWFKSLFSEEPDYLFPADSYQLTFDKLGQFNYVCGPHKKMTGLVTVVE